MLSPFHTRYFACNSSLAVLSVNGLLSALLVLVAPTARHPAIPGIQTLRYSENQRPRSEGDTKSRARYLPPGSSHAAVWGPFSWFGHQASVQEETRLTQVTPGATQILKGTAIFAAALRGGSSMF